MTTPQVEKLTDEGEALPIADAFQLLSKPTLDLTDEQILAIAQDLRRKRQAFLKGKADKPGSTKTKTATKISKEDKDVVTAHVTENILANLTLSFDE